MTKSVRKKTAAKVAFRRFDIAEKLKTEEDIADFMEAVIADSADDPAAIARALGHVARARSMAQLARDTGITREGLYKALAPDGNPSFATVAKVAKALGFKLTLIPA